MVLLSFIFYIFRIYATFVTFVHQYQQNELSPLTLNHRTLEKDYDMRLEIQIGATKCGRVERIPTRRLY
jgi:hypothetical protein